MKKTVVGLTGNMGSGKTTAARMIQEDVIPVFDADAAVRRNEGSVCPAVSGYSERR